MAELARNILRTCLAGALLCLGATGPALARQAEPPAAPSSHAGHGGMPGMDHGAMGHGAMPDMDHGAMGHDAMPDMDHGTLGHDAMPGMDHGAMNHDAMPGMDDEAMGAMPAMAPPAASDAVPPVEQAAPPVGSLPASDGTAGRAYADYGIHAGMMDGAVTPHLVLDKLGIAHDRERRTGLQWDGEFWIGRDIDKLWIKSEGERVGGRTDGKVQAFWSHAVSPFWDLQLGARRDIGAGPRRNWAAFGVQGTAPYGIETELTGYVGAAGRTALALKAEYDLLLTQRLVFTPELEASAYGRNDRARGVGAGLSDAALSLRLRYEITRDVAPYVGVSFGRKFGDTARYAQAQGDGRSDRSLLAGVRIQF